MQRSRLLLLGIVALLVLAMAAGCGGDSDSESTNTAVAGGEPGGTGTEGSSGQQEAEKGSKKAENGSKGADGDKGATENGSAEGNSTNGSSGGGGSSGDGTGDSSKSGIEGTGQRQKSQKKAKAKPPSSSGGGAQVATLADFIKAADAVCAEAETQIQVGINPYAQRGLQALAKEAPEVVSKVIVPSLEGEMNGIRQLETPGEAQEVQGSLLVDIQAMITESQAKPKDFIFEGESVAKSEESAKAAGFTRCGGIA
jgi:hypothetical protein